MSNKSNRSEVARPIPSWHLHTPQITLQLKTNNNKYLRQTPRENWKNGEKRGWGIADAEFMNRSVLIVCSARSMLLCWQLRLQMHMDCNLIRWFSRYTRTSWSMRRVTGFCLTQDINIITSNDIKPVKLSIDRWQRSLDRQLFFS